MLVAFATSSKVPDLTSDDRLLVDALSARGVAGEPAVWNDPAAEWRRFGAVIIRSTWDYHLFPDAFAAWLDVLESASVPVWNPPSLVRWNAEKTYLRDLSARGVAVVPTLWVERGSLVSLGSVLAERGWNDAVVKPAISASAHRTWRTSVSRADADEPVFHAMVAEGRVLVQPYLSAVGEVGEWSLLFYGGEYSHAVLKRPASGDFRVQKEFGGTATLAEPVSEVIEAARMALVQSERGSARSLYARVDGCEIDGRFVLMEIELIEPDLFLRSHPRAPDRLAAAFVELSS